MKAIILAGGLGALEWLFDMDKAWEAGADMHRFTLDQIAAYERLPLQE